MAFSDLGGIGTASASAAGGTLVITTTAGANAGDCVVVWVAWDNNNAGTTTNLYDSMLRCDDAVGNDYHTIGSGQRTAGLQNAGAHLAMFAAVLDTDLPSGSAITITHIVTTLVAKAASAHRFGCAKANVVVPLNGIVSAEGNTDPASVSLASMTGSTEYLCIHGVALEGPSTDTYTQDADYTSIATASSAVGGAADGEMTIRGGYRIQTATGDTVDVTNSTNRDHKQILVALRETNAPYVRWSSGKLEVATMHSATSGAPSFVLGGNTSADCAWYRGGDVLLFIQAGQQTVLIPNLAAALGELVSVQIAGSQRVTVGDITLTVGWQRLRDDADGGTFTGQDVSQANYGTAVILGGCNPYGTPFEFFGDATEAGADTSVEFPAGTTSADDELIVLIGSHGIDSNSAQYSAFTNANLRDVDEITDLSTTLLNGVGIGVGVGYKDTAGAIGTSTATLAASDVDITKTLAFKPKNAAEPSSPYVRRVLTMSEGIGALSLTWQATDLQAGDVIVVFVETESQDATTPTDYTEFPDSPQDTTGVRLEAYYKVATGSETGVTIADSGDHQIAVALAVGNAASVPYDVTAGGTEATSDTTLSATGGTTTLANDLVLVAASHSTDSANNQFHSFANTDLGEFQHVCEYTGASGAGGGIAVASGVKAAAGSFGATTGTLMTASPKSFLTIALRVLRESYLLPNRSNLLIPRQR